MRRGIDPLRRLAAFLLLAFLPAIAAAKDSHPSSSQWQTTAEAKLKDKTERAGCAL